MLSTLMVSVAPGGVVNAPLRRAAKGVGHSGDGVPSCSQSIRLGNSRASGPQRRGLQGGGAVREVHVATPTAGGRVTRIEVRSATADEYNARQIVCAAFSEKCPLFPNTVPLFSPYFSWSCGLSEGLELSITSRSSQARQTGKQQQVSDKRLCDAVGCGC